jgi:hypothetical protein
VKRMPSRGHGHERKPRHKSRYAVSSFVAEMRLCKLSMAPSKSKTKPKTSSSETPAIPAGRKPYSGTNRKLVVAFDVGTTFSGVSYA